MQIVKHDSSLPYISVSGDVDISSSNRLRRVLEQAIKNCKNQIELDLRGVTFIDSSGIRVISDCALILRQSRRTLNIVECSQIARKHIADCGLSNALGLKENDADSEWASGNRHQKWLFSSFSVPANLITPAVIRERIARLINGLRLSDTETADVELAVGEAATNAYKYGCKDSCGKISVWCTADYKQLMIEIADTGCGFDQSKIASPDWDDLPTCGMGIAIMKLVMDEVEFEFHGGTTVRMIKKLHR